jgi:hypothetical protein
MVTEVVVLAVVVKEDACGQEGCSWISRSSMATWALNAGIACREALNRNLMVSSW